MNHTADIAQTAVIDPISFHPGHRNRRPASRTQTLMNFFHHSGDGIEATGFEQLDRLCRRVRRELPMPETIAYHDPACSVAVDYAPGVSANGFPFVRCTYGP